MAKAANRLARTGPPCCALVTPPRQREPSCRYILCPLSSTYAGATRTKNAAGILDGGPFSARQRVTKRIRPKGLHRGLRRFQVPSRLAQAIVGAKVAKQRHRRHAGHRWLRREEFRLHIVEAGLQRLYLIVPLTSRITQVSASRQPGRDRWASPSRPRLRQAAEMLKSLRHTSSGWTLAPGGLGTRLSPDCRGPAGSGP